MIVTSLEVSDYRNCDYKKIEFTDGVNAFVAPNASGKTNLLEAVYFCGVGKSFRTPREKELIKNDRQRAFISLVASKETGDERVKIALDRACNKRVAVNDVPISRISSLMGVCPVVLFCPDGLKIIKEAPADRRQFMDIALCQISKVYFAALSRYNKILQNRNKLLKSNASVASLSPWDELLATEGAKIVKSRKGYVNRLQEPTQEYHKFLSNGLELPFLEYEGVDGESVEEIKQNLLDGLKKSIEQDLKQKFTHIGPHRDDISITVNDADIRAYGSQGQQRTIALSLKLAELRLLSSRLGTTPVLLLDDVFSELDADRQNKLLSSLTGFQTIITCTDDCFLGHKVNIIRI